MNKNNKLKTYVMSQGDYMGDEPGMYSLKAKNLEDVLNQIFECDGEVDVDSLLEQNGDGQPYLQIFCVEENKVVFG